VNVYYNRAGAVIISSNKKQYPVSVKLHFECTNNTAEYEACILSLEAALELKIKKIDVYGEIQPATFSHQTHILQPTKL
jgi:ribonuclease HI